MSNLNSVQYDPQPDDVARAQQQINQVFLKGTIWSVVQKINIWILILMLIGTGVTLMVKIPTEELIGITNQNLTAIIFFSGLFSFVILNSLLTKKIKQIRDNPENYLGMRHDFEIQEEFLVQRVGHNETYYALQQIDSLQMSNDFILVFIDPTYAAFIPVHAFLSQKDCEEFYQQLTTAWQIAKENKPLNGKN